MRIVLEGAIAGVAFASGDTFVIGMWTSGPLGPMTDVMWSRPDRERVLLAPSGDTAAFISGIYEFDETRVVPCASTVTERGFSLAAGDLRVEAELGRPHRLFTLRPKPLRRSLAWVRVEDEVARRIGRFVIGGTAGVRLRGTTPGGAREWYRIDGYRPVVAARGELAGRDLGPLTGLRPDVGFGFSGFPTKPAFVTCSPVLEDVTLAPG
ncbi:MAG TPA: hypothetical protein VEU29_07915 [Actinomycetota bacterium]|nr:hypothetical protein [Actinomycetota bacterium]